MRIVTLNIRHGGGTRGEALASYLLSMEPEVVVLSEFRDGATGRLILERLAQAGLIYAEATYREPRQNSVCVVSSHPISRMGLPGPVGEEHRVLLCEIADLRLAAVYFPQGEDKRQIFEYLRSTGLPALGRNGIMIGDFNTGLHGRDEAGATFQCVDALVDLLGTGLTDSWRSRNPQAREFSWFSRIGNGFRIDHAFCTPDLDSRIAKIDYRHEPREQGITDHSALTLELASLS